MHATAGSGAGTGAPASFGQIALTGLSALLFLAGGVATYLEPSWNPPLYIAGSSVMLINVVATAGARMVRAIEASPGRTAAVTQTLTVASVLAAAFCCGYLL